MQSPFSSLHPNHSTNTTRIYVAFYEKSRAKQSDDSTANDTSDNDSDEDDEHEVAVTFDKTRMRVHILEKLAASKLGIPPPLAHHRLCLALRTPHGKAVLLKSVLDVKDGDRYYLKVVRKGHKLQPEEEQQRASNTTINDLDFCELLQSTFPKAGGSDMAVRASRRAQQQRGQPSPSVSVAQQQQKPATHRRSSDHGDVDDDCSQHQSKRARRDTNESRPEAVPSTPRRALFPVNAAAADPATIHQPKTPTRPETPLQQRAQSAVKAAAALIAAQDDSDSCDDSEDEISGATIREARLPPPDPPVVKTEKKVTEDDGKKFPALTSPVRRSDRISMLSPAKKPVKRENETDAASVATADHNPFAEYEQQRKQKRRRRSKAGPKQKPVPKSIIRSPRLALRSTDDTVGDDDQYVKSSVSNIGLPRANRYLKSSRQPRRSTAVPAHSSLFLPPPDRPGGHDVITPPTLNSPLAPSESKFPVGDKYFLWHVDGFQYPVFITGLGHSKDSRVVKFDHFGFRRDVWTHQLSGVSKKREAEWKSTLLNLNNIGSIPSPSCSSVVSKYSRTSHIRGTSNKRADPEEREWYGRFGPYTDSTGLQSFPWRNYPGFFVRESNRLVFLCRDLDTPKRISRLFPRVPVEKILFDNRPLLGRVLESDTVLNPGTPIVLPLEFRGLVVAGRGSPLELDVRRQGRSCSGSSCSGSAALEHDRNRRNECRRSESAR